MTDAASVLLTELQRLPAADRAELAHFLLNSLDEIEPVGRDEISAVWRDEIARRAAEIHNGTATLKPAIDVLARIRNKYA